MVGDIVHENCFRKEKKTTKTKKNCTSKTKQKIHECRLFCDKYYFNRIEPHQPKCSSFGSCRRIEHFRFRHSYSNIVFYCAIAFVIIVLWSYKIEIICNCNIAFCFACNSDESKIFYLHSTKNAQIHWFSNNDAIQNKYTFCLRKCVDAIEI